MADLINNINEEQINDNEDNNINIQQDDVYKAIRDIFTQKIQNSLEKSDIIVRKEMKKKMNTIQKGIVTKKISSMINQNLSKIRQIKKKQIEEVGELSKKEILRIQRNPNGSFVTVSNGDNAINISFEEITNKITTTNTDDQSIGPLENCLSGVPYVSNVQNMDETKVPGALKVYPANSTRIMPTNYAASNYVGPTGPTGAIGPLGPTGSVGQRGLVGQGTQGALDQQGHLVHLELENRVR